jgi:hypothetical protein
MNPTVNANLLNAVLMAFPGRAAYAEVVLGLLEGLVLHGGKSFPGLCGEDVQKLERAGVLARIPGRYTLGRQPQARAFTDELCEIFRDVTGKEYAFTPKDGGAVAALLLKASKPDIIARWRLGLASTGWTQVANLTQLMAKWNDLAVPKGKMSNAQVNEGDVF